MLTLAANAFFRIKHVFVISMYTFKLVSVRLIKRVVDHRPSLLKNSGPHVCTNLYFTSQHTCIYIQSNARQGLAHLLQAWSFLL